MRKNNYLALGLLMLISLTFGCNSSGSISKSSPPPDKVEYNHQEAEKKKIANLSDKCSKCHAPGSTKKGPTGQIIDTSLAGLVKNIKNHPTLKLAVTYNDCTGCHNKDPQQKQKHVSYLQNSHLENTSYLESVKEPCFGCHSQK